MQSEKQKIIAQFITERYDAAKNAQGRTTVESNLQKSDRAWRLHWFEDDHFYSSNRSKYHSGLSFMNIRAITNRAMHVLFRNDPPFEPTGYDAADEEVIRKIIVPYTRWQLDDIKFKSKNRRAWEYFPKYGTILISTPWRKQIKSRRIREPVEVVNEKGEIETKMVKKYVPQVIYDNVDFIIEDLFNVHYIGKNVKGVNSAEALIIDNWMSLEELAQYRDGNGWAIMNLDELKKTPPEEGYHRSKEDLRKQNVDLEEVGDSKSRNKYHVKMYFGLLPRSYVEGNPSEKYEQEEWVPAFAWVSNHLLILNTENPYDHLEIPHLDARFVEDDLSPYGRSLPEVLRKTEAYLNDTYNMYQDGTQQNLCKMFGGTPEFMSINKGAKLEFSPNKIWQALDKNSIFPLELGIADPNAVNIIGLLTQQAQLLGAVPRSMQGTGEEDAGGGTASGLAMVLDQAQLNLLGVIQDYEESILVPFIRRMWQLNRQFKDTEIVKIMRVCTAADPESEEYRKIRALAERALADDMKYDFRWKGATEMEAYMVKQRKVVQFLEILANAAKVAPQALQQMALRIDLFFLLRIAYEYSGLQNADAVFPVNGVEQMISVREVMAQLQMVMQNLPPECQKEIAQVIQLLQAVASGQYGPVDQPQGGNNFQGTPPGTPYTGREGDQAATETRRTPIRPTAEF